jgi:hypothetical protein
VTQLAFPLLLRWLPTLSLLQLQLELLRLWLNYFLTFPYPSMFPQPSYLVPCLFLVVPLSLHAPLHSLGRARGSLFHARSLEHPEPIQYEAPRPRGLSRQSDRFPLLLPTELTVLKGGRLVAP